MDAGRIVIVCVVAVLADSDNPETQHNNPAGLIFEDSAMWLIAQN